MKIVSAVIFLLLLQTANAQLTLSSLIRPTNPGEMVPDLVFSPLSNYATKSAKLSQFKGKLVILDFWGINCAPCIKAFPKLHSLQKQFGDSIQIILVTPSSQNSLDSIIQRRKKIGIRINIPSSLISLTGNTMLSKYFPYKIIPHYVWIDIEGRLAAVTKGEVVTEENIRKKLRDPQFYLPQKKDILTLDRSRPMFPQLQNVLHNEAKKYSVITEHVEGLSGFTTIYQKDTSENTIRVFRGNYSILELCGNALSNFQEGSPYLTPTFDYGKRAVLEVKDSGKYLFDANKGSTIQDWKRLNTFCYEMVVAGNETGRLTKYMLSDIERFFNVEARIEKRRARALALVRTSGIDKVGLKKQITERTAFRDTLGVYHIIGMNGLTILRTHLSQANKASPYIFLDNTGYGGRVELHLTSQLDDLPALKKELNEKYDLDLIETEAEVDMIVISENDF